MGHHKKVVCSECDKVIRQCRCMHEKEVIFEICDQCAEAIESDAHMEMYGDCLYDWKE